MSLSTPVNESKRNEKVTFRRNTSSVLWTAGCVLSIGFLLLRTPSLFATAVTRMQELPAVQKLGNPALVETATAFAFYLGIVLNATGIILYFSLASVVESRIFPPLKASFRKIDVGFLGCCSLGCIVPVQLYALVFQVISPKDSWVHYFFIFLVASITLICYRKKWRPLPSVKRMAAIASCYLCCLVSVSL